MQTGSQTEVQGCPKDLGRVPVCPQKNGCCYSTWHFLGTHVIGGKVWELTRKTDHADDLQTVK